MRLSRRQFLQLAGGAAAALPTVSQIAKAQTYPARPVRIFVGYPAGGPTDIIARIMAQHLSQRLGQPFIIENRPGANSNVAADAVVRARPDGYTLFEMTSSNAFNATLYDNLNFDVLRDIAPVASISRGPGVMEVNPSVPARTVAEFIAYAKDNPGKINMASGGSGSPQHVWGELFEVMAGIKLLHVPYRGAAPALIDLIGGQVQVMFDPMSSSIEHIRAGRLRALAVTTATRTEALPDLPTVADFLPGYEASGWQGLAAPRGTPVEIISALNNEVNAGLADPKMKARLADLGSSVLPGSPADFRKLVAADTEKWANVIRAANIKPE